MRICQILAEGAGPYAQKCVDNDSRSLGELGISSMLLALTGPSLPAQLDSFDIALVYGASRVTQSLLRRLRCSVVDEPVARSPMTRLARWAPALVTTPLSDLPGTIYLPEAVSQTFFDSGSKRRLVEKKESVVGYVGRPGGPSSLAASIGVRIERFRDDVRFREFATIPSPDEMTELDLWIDPAAEDDDFGGGVAEALVAGIPVIAARTPINILRLANGESGFLVPKNDPNEFVHVALNSLFKPEASRSKADFARSDTGRFLPDLRKSTLKGMLQMLEERR